MPRRLPPEAKISVCEQEEFLTRDKERFFIAHIEEGCAVLQLYNRHIYVSAGALLFLPRSVPLTLLTSYHLKATSVSFLPEFVNVHLTWPLVESPDYPRIAKMIDTPSFHLFYEQGSIYEGVLPLDASFNDSAAGLMRHILHQCRVHPDGKWSCRARAFLFELLELGEYIYRLLTHTVKVATLEEQVVEYIHLHLGSPLALEHICDHFGTNHTTLCRRFKEYTGVSVGNYIQERRLLQARHALAFTNLSVEEIAGTLGFRDGAYFARVFGRTVGLTPLKYRQEMRQKRDELLENLSL